MSRSPREFACPACLAPVGETCTAPSDTGRKPVSWHHLSRVIAAETSNAGQPDTLVRPLTGGIYADMAVGHLNRKGHQLQGVLYSTDDGLLWDIARSCCGPADS